MKLQDQIREFRSLLPGRTSKGRIKMPVASAMLVRGMFNEIILQLDAADREREGNAPIESGPFGAVIPDVIVLVGDTRSHKNVALLKGLGWGRMRVLNMTKPFEGEPWALDNGAFGAWRKGAAFDGPGFLKRVAKAVTMPAPFMCVLPDIVAGGLESLALSLRWLDELPAHLPWYLVVQDGMTVADVEPHIARVAGLFLGGTLEFKATAKQWADLAHAHGKLFHFGRAASIPKIQLALASGCNSLDTCFPLWTNERMVLFQRLVAGGDLTDAERAQYHRRGARKTGTRPPKAQLRLCD